MKANCHRAIHAARRLGAVCLCLFLLVACARETPQSTPDSGGLSAKIIWPQPGESDQDSQGSRALSDSCETYGVSEVVFLVTDANPENHLAKVTFACDKGQGVLENIPKGNDRVLTVSANSPDGICLYRAQKQGITITGGKTTHLGPLELEKYLICNDSDSDTYYAEDTCGTEPDCNDDDDAVYPGATEVCDDAKDNDCDGDSDCDDADCAPHTSCIGTYTNSLGMTFSLIPAGKFIIGAPMDEAGWWDGEYQHEVTLTEPFYIQTTEVTQGQYEAVMETNPSHFSACGNDCPVEQVSWQDAQAFISALNARGEGTYRLPTSAEWEYAARAGSTTAYPDGNMESDGACNPEPNLEVIGWFCGNSDEHTHRVAQKQPNAWGLYDTHGNVAEWCKNWYAHYPEDAEAVTDPQGPPEPLPPPDNGRVTRGGDWNDFAWFCRSAKYGYELPDARLNDLGLRLVREP